MITKVPINRKGFVDHFALVDDEDSEKILKEKWYLVIHRWPTLYTCTNRGFLMQSFILPKSIPGYVRHHKNQNGLDNTRDNLEFITNEKNCQIRRMNSNNKSGHTGISHGGVRRWLVHLDGRYIGTFKYEDRAIEARRAAEIKYRGFASS